LKEFDKKMMIFKDNKVVNWHEHVYFKPGIRNLDEKACDDLVELARLSYMDYLVILQGCYGGKY